MLGGSSSSYAHQRCVPPAPRISVTKPKRHCKGRREVVPTKRIMPEGQSVVGIPNKPESEVLQDWTPRSDRRRFNSVRADHVLVRVKPGGDTMGRSGSNLAAPPSLSSSMAEHPGLPLTRSRKVGGSRPPSDAKHPKLNWLSKRLYNVGLRVRIPPGAPNQPQPHRLVWYRSQHEERTGPPARTHHRCRDG